ncbi:hypothetical protein ACFFX0_14355 [Citricoccus parietis]|uniref:Uncharacterized protein n=1 Tax=Citricoccus parietis TaxID=592307 RepID=A0ABV5G051_9MICC
MVVTAERPGPRRLGATGLVRGQRGASAPSRSSSRSEAAKVWWSTRGASSGWCRSMIFRTAFSAEGPRPS